jgi:uncharacterized protein (DUF2141 family)
MTVRMADDHTLCEITVSVRGLRNSEGRVLALLFASENGFPGEVVRARARARTAALSGGRATIVFSDVPVGTYAAAVVHDENGNGKLDTNFLGIPDEGVGASNRARERPGPPRWGDAKFEVRGDTVTQADVYYF